MFTILCLSSVNLSLISIQRFLTVAMRNVVFSRIGARDKKLHGRRVTPPKQDD